MTQLVTLNQNEERALAAMLGASTDATSSALLPILKINLEDEDDAGNQLKKGTFMLTGQEDPIYAEKVTIRPLSQMFQWVDYNAEEKRSVNKTIIIPRLNMEARDEKGGVRCGKPASKVIKENPDLIKKYKSITCFRYVHCLVSYKGKTADGKDATVENVPALLRLKGANFSPFEDEVIKRLPKGAKLYEFNVEITATRKKNGSVVYYVLGFNPDLGNRLGLDQTTVDTLKYILNMVQEENQKIESKHLNSARNRSVDSAALKAVEILEDGDDSLEADLED